MRDESDIEHEKDIAKQTKMIAELRKAGLPIKYRDYNGNLVEELPDGSTVYVDDEAMELYVRNEIFKILHPKIAKHNGDKIAETLDGIKKE